MEMVKKILVSMTAVRWVLLVIELLLFIWFAAAFPFGNAGTVVGGGMCGVMMILTLGWKGVAGFIRNVCKTGAGKAVVITCGVILALIVVYVILLSVMMLKAIYTKPDKPNVVVVLGCKVRGDGPSKMLRIRLDAAKELLDEYPDVKCVVSGGQGSDEQMTEAECMKNYLVKKGISADRIIMEDKSKTTFENMKFTFEKLDELGISRDITIVTDGYHLYRASLIAKEQGAGEVTCYGADTEFRHIASHWVREWMGLTKFILFGK